MFWGKWGSDTSAAWSAAGASGRGVRVLLTVILLPRIARLSSNCSTGDCVSNFNKRISSNNSN